MEPAQLSGRGGKQASHLSNISHYSSYTCHTHCGCCRYLYHQGTQQIAGNVSGGAQPLVSCVSFIFLTLDLLWNKNTKITKGKVGRVGQLSTQPFAIRCDTPWEILDPVFWILATAIQEIPCHLFSLQANRKCTLVLKPKRHWSKQKFHHHLRCKKQWTWWTSSCYF